MSQNKKAYFHGGGGPNEPAPKQKKYKSDPAIVVQPRFEEPFYRNYDLYDVGGKVTPGTGAYHADKNKSIKDFLKHKRKRLKNKYKAQDSWIIDSDENRKERIERMRTRANLLSKLMKVAIDFPIDDQIQSGPISENSGSYDQSTILGGRLDQYLPSPDFEGKMVGKLNFGRDYEGETEQNKKVIELLNKFISKYYAPDESELLNMLNGFDPDIDLNALKALHLLLPELVNPNGGKTIYNKMSF